VGYVPQNHRIFPHWSVRQNVLAGARRALATSTEAAFNRHYRQVIETLELGPLLERRPAKLSGGERQRVSLGRALCSGPDLLLLDEPLASLDAGLRQRILRLLLRIKETFDVPMLLVSHQPSELQALCDEVLAMDRGKLIARGTPVDVFTQPQVHASIEATGAFENLLKGHLVGHCADSSRVRLMGEHQAPELVLPRFDWPLAEQVLLRLKAHDILLATGPISGVSARNQLKAEVVELRELPGKVMALLKIPDYEGEPMAAELTQHAVSDLNLSSGKTVYLLIKASSLQVS
jgi:molybdate transport system ATP-binding protein